MSCCKEMCPYCKIVIRQCNCATSEQEKLIVWKTCGACLRAGYPNGVLSCEEAIPPDTSSVQAFRNLRRDVYNLFDIPLDTPLPKAMSLMQDFRTRYNDKDARYMHLMAACEVALGKDGPFEATSAAARIEQIMEEHKELGESNLSWARVNAKLNEDLVKVQERIKHLNDHLDVKDAEIRRLAEDLDKEKGCHETCETVRGFLNSDIATLRDMLSNRGAFLAELRNALSEPTCDETHLINRVKGEVEVNRTVRGKLQAALGLKDEEVSSHYDLADDVCDRVGRYDSLQMHLCEALHLAAGSDEALVRQVNRLRDFRKHVCTILATGPAPDSYILKVLAERLQASAPAPTEAPGTFWKELENLLNRYSQEKWSNTPDFILAEYMDRCRRAFDDGVAARDKWYGVALKPGCSKEPQEPQEAKPWKPEGPGWQGTMPTPRTWKAGERVAPEDIQVGMKFQDYRCVWEVKRIVNDEVFAVSKDPKGQWRDYPGTWGRYRLSQSPLAEAFTEGV